MKVDDQCVSQSAPATQPRSRWMRLEGYRPTNYAPGRPVLVRALWYLISTAVLESGWFPWSAAKCWLLRRFGAEIGRGVVIKPHVRIKFPWRLSVGDHTWIGEDTWIDNLADVRIGHDCCLSQGSYLCTGSHDHRRMTFDLQTASIDVGNEVWIAARSMLLPGARVADGVVVAAGSVVTGNLEIPAGVLVAGTPARVLGPRFPSAEQGEMAENWGLALQAEESRIS